MRVHRHGAYFRCPYRGRKIRVRATQPHVICALFRKQDAMCEARQGNPCPIHEIIKKTTGLFAQGKREGRIQ